MTAPRVKITSIKQDDHVQSARLFADIPERMLVAAAVCQPGFFQQVRADLEPADFTVQRHVEIWNTCSRVADAGCHPTLSSVGLELCESGFPAGCTLGYLADLQRDYLEISDPALWVNAIRRASRERQALALLSKLKAETDLEGYRSESVRACLEALAQLEGDAGPEDLDALPDVLSVATQETRWVTPGEIALGAVTLWSSEGGTGKSTLALYRAIETAIQDNRDVLILDAENGATTIAERISRFNLSRTPDRLKVFGGWIGETPDPSDPRVLAWVTTKHDPLVIVDPLIAFLARAGLDENSAGDVRKWFAGPRRLANANAAVLVLAHGLKNGSGYRGSTDIKNAVDALFDLENAMPGENLQRITLRAIKRRVPIDPFIALEWHMEECGFRRRELTRAETNAEVCERILKAHPGATKRAFIEAATKAGASWHSANQFLDSGAKSGTVRRESAGKGHQHFWIGAKDDD